MGQYEIQNSSILTQESEQITYYNSEKQTYLVSAINLENESQGVWMVRHFLDHDMAEYYPLPANALVLMMNHFVLDNTRPRRKKFR